MALELALSLHASTRDEAEQDKDSVHQSQHEQRPTIGDSAAFIELFGGARGRNEFCGDEPCRKSTKWM
jgi:hypothetical protein